MKTHKIIDIHDIKSLKEYFQKNKVLAYGNGSVYNKIKFYLEQYNLHFEDVIYTSNSSILSISGQTYEDSLRDYSIFICSSFYEEIIEFLKSKKIKSITVPTIIIDEKSNKLFHRTLMNKKHKLFINNSTFAHSKS